MAFNREGDEIIKNWLLVPLSIGIFLFPVHNYQQPGFQYIFLPHIAVALIVFSVANILRSVKWEWGNKAIAIPVLIIIGSAWGRLAVSLTMVTLAGALLLTVLAGLYFVTRLAGRRILAVLYPVLFVQAASVLIQAAANPGLYAGGWVTTYYVHGMSNYDIAIGFMIFGLLLSEPDTRWWLSYLTIPATILTGAGEGLVSLGILGVFGTIRRDWGKKLIPLMVVLLILIGAGIASGAFQRLYNWAHIGITTISQPAEFEQSVERATYGEHPFWGRVRVWGESLGRLKPLGNGYEVVKFTADTVHNVPLVIVDQLGLPAGIAWLWVSLYCLVKTKYKALWVGILSLCIFDHFVWTQLAPWWWVAVGISTTVPLKTDMVYRRANDDTRGKERPVTSPDSP